MTRPQQQPVKDFAKDMRREVHVTPTVRKVIVFAMILAILALGTCMLIGPLVSPTNPYDTVQQGAERAFDVAPPDGSSQWQTPEGRQDGSSDTAAPMNPAPSQFDPPRIEPVDPADPGRSGQPPPTVYTPPSTP